MTARRVAWFTIALVVLVACGSSSSEQANVDCGDAAGRTIEHPISALDTKADRALVHVPPCYDTNEARYPVVYLMHAGGTSAEMWTNHPIEATRVIDELVLSDELRPVIAVMPYGASGRPEFLAGEFDVVLASIDDTFRTIAQPEARAIAGVSAGGTTAAYLAADNASTDFAALGLFMSVWGPTLDEVFPAGILDGDLVPEVLVDIGEDDGLRTYTEDMAEAFAAAGIDADMQVHPGDHDAQFVAERFPDWIRWLIERVTLEV